MSRSRAVTSIALTDKHILRVYFLADIAKPPEFPQAANPLRPNFPVSTLTKQLFASSPFGYPQQAGPVSLAVQFATLPAKVGASIEKPASKRCRSIHILLETATALKGKAARAITPERLVEGGRGARI